MVGVIIMEKRSRKEIVKLLLEQNWADTDKDELMELIIENPISINIDKQDEETVTFKEKLADKISAVIGSWEFILTFSIVIVLWIIINGFLLAKNAYDPYPFILLNLFLSCIAAVQAPIIMMSQNRESKKDALRNQNDYQTDLKSELILEELHHEMQTILRNQNKILTLLEQSEESENTKDNSKS